MRARSVTRREFAVLLSSGLAGLACGSKAGGSSRTDRLEVAARLEGEGGSERYGPAVTRRLVKGWFRPVLMVTHSSFWPNQAVYVEHNPETRADRVVLVQFVRWPFSTTRNERGEASGGGGSFSDEAREPALREFTPECARREAPISSETVDTLRELWRVMLVDGRVRDWEVRSILDGEIFQFADLDRTGHVCSPEPGSRMGELIAVGVQLGKLTSPCLTDRDGKERDLVSAAKALMQRMAASP